MAIGVPMESGQAKPPKLSKDQQAAKAKLAEALAAKYKTQMVDHT